MKKKIITILVLSLIFTISLFSFIIAYKGGVRGIGLVGVWFFMTAGVTVFLAQAIPAAIMFYSMGKALFGSPGSQEEPIPVSA